MIFRGREIIYTDMGRRVMDEIQAALGEEAVVEQPPKLEGRSLSMILGPKRDKKEKSKGA